jgi:hypothetical protein
MNSTERRAKILDTISKLEALKAHVRDNHDDMTAKQHAAATAEALALNVELQAAITLGASPCPLCKVDVAVLDDEGKQVFDEEGNAATRQVPLPAFGLAHESQGKGGSIRYLYEIGCKNSAHRDARATDLLPELAVERWNSGDYDPPRTGPAKAPGE